MEGGGREGKEGGGREGKEGYYVIHIHDFLLKLQVVSHPVELCSWVGPD